MLMVARSSRLLCLISLLCACSFSLTLQAQSSEADLKARLMNQPLYLRGCWRDDKLHFDSAGHIKGNSSAVTFTLSGFELLTLRLKQDKLVLEGRRIGLEFVKDKPQRVPLNAGRLGNPEDESMHIEIAASSSGDYGPALEAIFANGLAELVPSLPSYWNIYASKNFVPADAPTELTATPPAPPKSNPAPQPSGSPDTRPRRIGGGVQAPRLLRTQEPEFNETARRLKYGGVVLINLWVQPDGTVSHLSLLRPIGLGLDERALAAVQNYVFSPAMQNDKPVLVELNLEVSFKIF